MTRRFAFAFLAVLILAALSAFTRSTVVQGQQGPLCTMPQNLLYSPGATETFQGETYKCVFVYGENLTPQGVAWVKVRVSRVEQPLVP